MTKSLVKYVLTIAAFVSAAPLFCQDADPYKEKYESVIPEINDIIKNTKVVGVSIAIIEDYKVVWAKGFGLKETGTRDSVTETTLFQAASITKAVTAVAVMKKVQEGRIALNEDVNKQLISWHIPANDFTKQSPVTVKQLLSHTAGLSMIMFPAYAYDEQLPTMIQALNGEKPAHNQAVTVNAVPGKKFGYTGANYAVLEQLLIDIEKKDFAAIIQQEVLIPLQMKNSSFDFHLPTTEYPSIASGHMKGNEVIDGKFLNVYPLSFGSLWTTPTDLAKFLSEIQSAAKDSMGHILTQDYTKLMLTPVSYGGFTAGGQYALGFSLEKRGVIPFFGHDGHNYGYICSMLGSIEGGYGMVIMTNSENGWKAVNKIKKLIGRKYWGLGRYRAKK